MCWLRGLSRGCFYIKVRKNLLQPKYLLKIAEETTTWPLWRHLKWDTMLCGTQTDCSWAVTGAGWDEGTGTRVPSPTTETSVMPPSYAIIFALRPISTWEQCKLFKTRFSGLAIIIMMISISVAIASDYLAGNFAAWGRGSSREPTRIVRSEGFGERKEETQRESALSINKLWD